MKKVHFCLWGLFILLLGNYSQAQDSLGMHHVSNLEYWAGAWDIRMVGNLVYVVGVSEMHIMSLADPENPTEIGRFTWYPMTETGGRVYVLGNLAYLGIETGGFVLDVSDPSNILVLGQWTSTIGSLILFVHDGYAIAQNNQGHPYVLDISDPTNVHYIGDFTGNLTYEGVGIAGEYLCMSGYGLTVWDMSNPAEPQMVASIDTTFLTRHATISGNYAYLATLFGGLRIIDLSSPLQPIEAAVCDSNDWTDDVTVTGSYAVTAKSGPGSWLNIWNVADPVHPVFEGMITVEPSGSDRVVSSGNLVCTTEAGHFYSTVVISISNPAVPEVVSLFGPCGFLIRMAISGTTAYIADFYTELRTIDITDPHHPSELGHLNPNWRDVFDIGVRGNFAYVVKQIGTVGNNGIVAFDISNPAEPESLGYALYEFANRLVIEGDYAYVARLNNIATFSLANPALPQCVNVLNIPLGFMGIGLATLNGYLYYASESSFYVCSLSNPAAPEIVGSCNLGGSNVFCLSVAGDYAYVAGYSGVRIVNVSNPHNPIEINCIAGNWVSSVAAAGSIVIMDDYGLTRISIWDVTNPLNPILVGYYPNYEYILDIEIQGQYLFTTSQWEFRVFQCDALPNVVIPNQPIPTKFNLLPPYPNPFNPCAVIRFSLPYTEHTNLTIYDVTGRQVKVLADEVISVGEHRVTFDGSDLASGMYFVRLEAGQNLKTEKMVLLK